ncbi:MAG: YkgJ family cysteine cluster protein [bacterium]
MARQNERTIRCPEACQGLCCRYIVTKIKAPRCKLDFDEVYWFLCHDKVAVYVEKRLWYLLVDVPCRYLTRRSKCRMYRERPYVCRIHSPVDCEFSGKVKFQSYLSSPEDLKKYLKKRGIRLRMAWEDPDRMEDRRSLSATRQMAVYRQPPQGA